MSQTSLAVHLTCAVTDVVQLSPVCSITCMISSPVHVFFVTFFVSTFIWITSYKEQLCELRCQQLKNQWAWGPMTTNPQMGPLSCYGPEENPWLGMWQSQTHMRLHVPHRQHGNQARCSSLRQHRTRVTSMPNWPVLTSSTHLSWRQLVHGTTWPLSWHNKLAGASQPSQRTLGKQHSFSNAYCIVLY